jgi:hypothetical protein
MGGSRRARADHGAPEERRVGISRRTLIRRAAATGAVAWAAPMIIESLASPAAAITGLTGCHTILFNSSCSTDNQGTPCNFTACSAPNAALAQCVTITGDCKNGPITFSVVSGCDCTITNAAAKSGNDCITPTPPAGTSVTFPSQANPGYAQFAFNITCA